MNKFSIILPVHNGGHHFKECVASVLAQSLNDFNFIILDNNSNDGSKEWIESINDDRIKIYPSLQLLSIEENWARIKDVKKNEFITLIGHDDILHPNYLAVMNQLIIKYPDASLYFAHFNYINAQGHLIKKCRPMNETIYPSTFLQIILQKKIDIIGTGFMMRSKDYNSIGGIPNYPNLLFADYELWIRLTNISYLAIAPQNCFSFRIHQSTTTVSSDKKMLAAFFKFLAFLDDLKNGNSDFKKIIENNFNYFLLTQTKGLVSRLIKKPLNLREGLTVNECLSQIKTNAQKYFSLANFNFTQNTFIQLALIIDSNIFTRNLFLAFKKIYKKPLSK